MAKILFILHLPPPIHGAALMGQYIKESELINSSFDCRYINLATAGNLSNVGKFNFSKIFAFMKLFFNIFKTIINFKPNLVYITPTSCGKALVKDVFVVLLLKILGCKKIIAHYHNKGGAGINRFFKTKIILLNEKFYIDFEKHVPKKDVFICPNGIPKINCNLETIQQERLNTKPKILFLSNLIPEKGVFVLLKACKILTQKCLSFECIFAGAETKEIKAKNFENIENVKYIGAIYGKEKWELLRRVNLFCFPTFYSEETFGLVLVEAMQCALPVITVNIGGLSAIVENDINGFLIEKQNAIETANAIETLLLDTALREKMGNAGREKFEREFTIDIFEKNFAKIMEDNCK